MHILRSRTVIFTGQGGRLHVQTHDLRRSVQQQWSFILEMDISELPCIRLHSSDLRIR